MRIGTKLYSRGELERRIGSLRQLGGTRHVELAEGRAKGVAAIEVATGSGLDFTVLPDRGLDIESCSFKGLNLVYLTPSGIAHPAFHDPAGFEWLRTFSGGLLTTCGLTYFGDPGRDGEEELGLHGRYASLPALRVCDLSRWQGEDYLLEIRGTVEEASLFGDKLRLERSISSALGSGSLILRDRVQNFGSRPSPFTILYHLNAGFPLLDAGSELVCTSLSVEPYDAVSAAHLADVLRFQAPDPGFPSPGQDFLHTMAGDEEGYAWAAMINRSLGPAGGPEGLALYLRFRTDTLPFLNEWKLLAETDYVVGLEPVNTMVLNRARLRREGRLPMLAPGETRDMELELGVLEGAEQIGHFVERVGRIISSGRGARA